MDGEGIAFLVFFGLMSAASVWLAIRLTRTRRRLRNHGVSVEATIDREERLTARVVLYDLSFTTADGERVEKRIKGKAREDVAELVYDPEKPKRAYPPRAVFGRAWSVQVSLIWSFGAVSLFLFLVGLTAF